MPVRDTCRAHVGRRLVGSHSQLLNLPREAAINAVLITRAQLHAPETFAMAEFDKDLDARGLNCPLPILRTKKALTDMGAGQVLRIQATDPGSIKDFQAFAKQTGHELVGQSEANQEYTFLLKKRVSTQ